MPLSEEQQKKYIEAGGVRCPFCASAEIEGQSVEIDAGHATQAMGCQVCDREWVDRYVLVDVTAHRTRRVIRRSCPQTSGVRRFAFEHQGLE